MKTTQLFQVLTVLVLSIRFSISQTNVSARSSTLLVEPIAVVTVKTDSASTITEKEEIAYWLIVDDKSQWTIDEEEVLQDALQNTMDALAFHGIDGVALLDGYLFRHQTGDYVGDVEGRMGTIDHNNGEITLSDKAFTVQHGFAIYHELGHAVDYQLNRQLSTGFQKYTGGSKINSDGKKWQTTNNYWLRLQGRYDREEAAADAFAVLVMSLAGLGRPIFANQPVTTDYEAIAAAAAQVLQTSD